MPVEGAFDEEWGKEPEPVVSEESERKDLEPELTSAIPPTPEESGAESVTEDAPTHLRLIVVAALAALLVVGGTALFITRPWDPDAYRTHAVEDADTSMEGFPGTVTHLEGQDLIEDSERQQYLEDAEQKVEHIIVLMGQIDAKCEALEEPVETYLSTGVFSQGAVGLTDAREASEQLASSYDEVSALDLRGSDYESRQDSILVTAGYLQGRIDTLCMVWEALGSQDNPADALVAVRSAMSSGSEGRGLEEWRSLYENAYAGLEAYEE